MQDNVGEHPGDIEGAAELLADVLKLCKESDVATFDAPGQPVRAIAQSILAAIHDKDNAIDASNLVLLRIYSCVVEGMRARVKPSGAPEPALRGRDEVTNVAAEAAAMWENLDSLLGIKVPPEFKVTDARLVVSVHACTLPCFASVIPRVATEFAKRDQAR